MKLRPVRVLALAATFVATVVAGSGASATSDEPRTATHPGYHYESTYVYGDTQYAGFQITLTVAKPADVKSRHREHSLGQIAVGQRKDSSFLEAGWTQESSHGPPHLFIFWRPKSGKARCYNLGCGFRLRGPGMRPGHRLKVGSTLTVGYEHVGKKWWFLVNGQKSGFYPDKLWKGRFTGTDFAEAFGEVYVPVKNQVCADMGDGQYPTSGAAAQMYDAAWIGGPPLTLLPDPRNDAQGYGFLQTAPNAFAYGGPGYC